MLKLSCKHKNLSQVIVIKGSEVIHDLSIPCNYAVMKHNHITSESSRKHSCVTSESSRKHSRVTSDSSSKHSHTSRGSRKRTRSTSESTRKHTRTTAKSSKKHKSSRKHSNRISKSSRKHSKRISKSSRKHSNLTSESSRKDSEISSESCRQHHCSMLVSSRRHSSRSSGKDACCGHHCNSPLSSRQLAGCLSSCQNSIVTGSGDLTSVQQSPSSTHSRWSSEVNSSNQSSKLSSSSSSSSCAKTSAADGTNMECAVQDYSPLIIDATNVSKSKRTYTSSVCSVVDSIIGKKSECVEMVRELDYVFKAPGRKRRHADSLAPQTLKAKVCDALATSIRKRKSSRWDNTVAAHEHEQISLQHKDTLLTCVRKQKCSQHEEDSSVISLGSDDEVEIIDSDPKPQLSHSSTSDTLHKRKPETVIIDLCSPSGNLKYPLVTQKYMGHEDEKTSSGKYTSSERAFKEYVSVLGNGFHTASNGLHAVPSVASGTAYHGFVPFASAPASSACDPAVNSGVEKMQDCEVLFISGGKGVKNMNSSNVCGNSLQNQYHSDVRRSLQAIDNRMGQATAPSSSAYGNNLYNPHPDTVRKGLRPIVIDGSNVAMG